MLNRVARQARARGRASGRSSRREIAAIRKRRSLPATGRRWRATPIRCGPSASSPTCARPLPRDAIITTDVGWNKNGVGQQFPIYTPGHDLHAGRLRDDGLRRAGGAGRQARAAGRTVVALVGDGGFGQNPALLATAFEDDIARGLGDHEQLRVRHHRRPREGALRHDVRHGVREGRQAVFARLRGDRPGLRRRRREDRVGRRVQAGARARDQVGQARSSSTS